MYLQEKHLNDIDASDIHRLFSEKVKEGKTLDYKTTLRIFGHEDKNKLEFLFDITSFYNTDGGLIICGIEEKKDANGNTAIPDKFSVLELPNEDQVQLQIHNLVRQHTDPEITNLHLRELYVDNYRLLLIGIPKGHGLPSMVTKDDVNKYYKRHSAGKYVLGSAELSQLFLNADSLKQKAEDWKEKRLKEVRTTPTISDLSLFGSFFIHLIPHSFTDGRILDLHKLKSDKIIYTAAPISIPGGYSGYSDKFNHSGYYTYRKGEYSNKIESYNCYFRNGIIESYTTTFRYKNERSNIFVGVDAPVHICAAVKNALEIYDFMQVEPPFIVYLSAFDLIGATLAQVNYIHFAKFTLDELILPPVSINTISMTKVDIFNLLKPQFDIIFQSTGRDKCPEASNFNLK